jgi:cytochrome c553
VNSVISAACVGCHDSGIAKTHMKTNGGVINGTRVEGRAALEQCLVCHGSANNALNSTVPSIKAVHRWW